MMRHTLLVLALAAGCSKSKHATTVPAAPPPAPAATAATKPAETASVPASPHVAVSDDLATKCKLQMANVEQAPKFGYDDSALLPADRDVLEQVAHCMLEGPLRGHHVSLVGRTDPRGTDEYNLGLGTRRAETVRSFLERLGVPATSLAPTTRGEIDATGQDETGWQRDRRVDLELVN